MGISGGDSLLHRDGEGGCRGRLGSTIVGGLERRVDGGWVGKVKESDEKVKERGARNEVMEMTRSTD